MNGLQFQSGGVTTADYGIDASVCFQQEALIASLANVVASNLPVFQTSGNQHHSQLLLTISVLKTDVGVSVVDGNEVFPAKAAFELGVVDDPVGVVLVAIPDLMIERKLARTLFQYVVGNALDALGSLFLEAKLVLGNLGAFLIDGELVSVNAELTLSS